MQDKPLFIHFRILNDMYDIAISTIRFHFYTFANTHIHTVSSTINELFAIGICSECFHSNPFTLFLTHQWNMIIIIALNRKMPLHTFTWRD